MKTIAVITTRWGSKRLEGKALADICGKPMLQHIVDRARKSQYVDNIIVATTKDSEPIIDYCVQNRIRPYAGSNYDVLERICCSILPNKVDLIIYLWGDVPMIDPKRIDEVIEFYLANRYVYVYNYGVGVLSFRTLERLDYQLETPHDREYFHDYLKDFENSYVTYENNPPSVDTQEDLNEVLQIMRTA